MLRRPILLFFTLIGTLLAGALLFIQSELFARLAKTAVARFLPAELAELGIRADFAGFEIRFFPPGLSVREPVLTVGEPARVGARTLPDGSELRARSLQLNFVPLQMLSGDIRVHEVVVVDGTLRLRLSKRFLQGWSGNLKEDEASAAGKAKKTAARLPTLSFSPKWDELFRVRVENVALRAMRLELELERELEGGSSAEQTPAGRRPPIVNPPGGRLSAQLSAQELRLGQWRGAGAMGYELEARLEAIRAEPGLARRLSAVLGMSSEKLSSLLARPVDSAELLLRVSSEGFQIERAALGALGLAVRASGKLAGDPLRPASLAADLDLSVSGDVVRLAEAVNGAGPGLPPLGGSFAFSGRAIGNFFSDSVGGRAASSAQAPRLRGSLRAEGLRAGSWSANLLEAEGGWSGGEIELARLSLAGAEAERDLRAARPGGGGTLELGPLRYRPGSGGPLEFGARLNRAHLHWLLGPAARGVFGLGTRLSGAIEASILPPWEPVGPAGARGWSGSARLDLRAGGFQLDNQRLVLRSGREVLLSRPLRRVLRVPEIKLQGPVAFDQRAVRLDGLVLRMPRTELRASGSVDFVQGLGLSFTGPVNLDDVREIAEKPIRGEGKLLARVEGPPEKFRLLFDAELRQARYLGLDFGGFQGRIVWDDHSERLLFEDARVIQGATLLTGNGRLELSDGAQSAAFDLDIPRGNTQDLFKIFNELIAGLNWVPRSLRGGLTGKVGISGGLDLDALRITTELRGPSWEYLGERFRDVSMSAGYDGGRYFIDKVTARKRKGSLEGAISYRADSRAIDWSLTTQGLALADFDHIASLDVPMRGSVAFSSRGSGRIGLLGGIESRTELAITNFRVRGLDLPESRLELTSSGSALAFSGAALSGQARVEGRYDFRAGSAGFFRLALAEFDFSPALLLLNPSLMRDEVLRGIVSGEADLRFITGEVERASGRVGLSRYLLAKTGAAFELSRPVAAKVEGGSFELGPLVLRGNEREARLKLVGKNAKLSGSLDGELDLSVLEFLTPAIERSRGAARLDLGFSGTLNAPALSGTARAEGGSLQVRAVESPFEEVSGSFELRGNVITARDLRGRLAGGQVAAGGTVSLFIDRVPALALEGNLRDVKLKIFPFQYVRLRGRLGARGESLPYLVSGEVVADSALSKERMMTAQAGARALKAARYQPRPLVSGEGESSLFALDIAARAEKGVLVQNELFDAEAKGDLRIVNSLATPRLTGKVELLQGRMFFRDNVFQIQSAEMEFDSPTQLNPRFSLLAQAEAGNTKVNLFTSGRMDSFRIELTSNPPMPEQEILSLLAMGGTSSDIGRLNPGNRGMVESGSAASLALHALDVSRDLQEKTGFQLQIDEAVNSVVGNSIFQPRVDSGVTSSPKIVIRRRITKRFDLSLGSTVGLGTNVQREVNAEYRVSRGVSLLGVWNSLENVDTRNSLGSSFGLDLRLQQRFQ
jgi:hypothetical protein